MRIPGEDPGIDHPRYAHERQRDERLWRLEKTGRALLIGAVIPRPEDPAESISGTALVNAAALCEFIAALAPLTEPTVPAGTRAKRLRSRHRKRQGRQRQ